MTNDNQRQDGAAAVVYVSADTLERWLTDVVNPTRVNVPGGPPKLCRGRHSTMARSNRVFPHTLLGRTANGNQVPSR
jgi:hypothetical protein